jgi:hypothetical protein
MYSAFRDNKQNLPGDEEILKNQKPSLKVYLYPFKSDIPMNLLPKLQSPQLILQPQMSIEALKKYLVQKLSPSVTNLEEVIILYKNQEIPNHYTLKDIQKIFGFSDDKTIFNYMKKQIQQTNTVSVNSNVPNVPNVIKINNEEDS